MSAEVTDMSTTDKYPYPEFMDYFTRNDRLYKYLWNLGLYVEPGDQVLLEPTLHHQYPTALTEMSHCSVNAAVTTIAIPVLSLSGRLAYGTGRIRLARNPWLAPFPICPCSSTYHAILWTPSPKIDLLAGNSAP